MRMASVVAACCALSAAAAVVSGAVAPALPVAAGVVATVVDAATGTGMMTAIAVTGTAVVGWDEPADAAVAVSEPLPSLAAESFLPCLLLSVLDDFDVASLLAAVFAPALGLAGALLRSGEAAFEGVSGWF